MQKMVNIYHSEEKKEEVIWFLKSNYIISNAQAVHRFLNEFDEHSDEMKGRVLEQIVNALRAVSTNGYFLAKEESESKKYWSCSKEELNNQNHSSDRTIISAVVFLILRNVDNFKLFSLLLLLLDSLLLFSSIQSRLVRTAFQTVLTHFHKNIVQPPELFALANILKSLFNAKNLVEKDPRNIAVFHGGKGIELQSGTSNQLQWLFKDGLSVCLWINIEAVKWSEGVQFAKIFTFHAQDVGGVQCFLIDNKVYYRVLKGLYNEPQQGNGILLGELEPKKWNFICIVHQGHRTLSKSSLFFYLNKNKGIKFVVEAPKIQANRVTKYKIFTECYLQCSSIALFPLCLKNEEVQELINNINSIEHIKHPRAHLLEVRQGCFHERRRWAYSPQYVYARDKSMDLRVVLPLFYLSRFLQREEYPTVNQLLGIVVVFLRQSQHNQQQAAKKEYFKIISHLLCEVQHDVFNASTVKVVLHIKHTITDSTLLDQYFTDLVWPLLQTNTATARKQQLLEVLKSNFTQNIAHYTPLIGLDEMLNLVLALQNPRRCCPKHFSTTPTHFDKELSRVQPRAVQGILFSLIELLFQSPKINYASECYKICRLLSLKHSPCFTLDLIRLIRRMLTQKLAEKLSQSQAKKILKYFQEHQMHMILIHVIENNYFAEIKAQCIKLIYPLLLKKASVELQSTVSSCISKILWKINEAVANLSQSQILQQQSLSEQKLQKKQSFKRSQFVNFKESLLSNKNQSYVGQDQQKDLHSPKAPALSNRLKKDKTFNFQFAVQQPKPPLQDEREIMEEQKTREPQIEFEVIRGKKKMSLSINTDAINEMYTFGGEKGQQIVVSETEQIMQMTKIKDLAIKCVAKMKSSVNNEAQRSAVNRQLQKSSKQKQWSMNTKEKQSRINQKQSETNKIRVPIVPPTTRNKVGKMTSNLALAQIEEEEAPRLLTPANKSSSKSPSSLMNAEEESMLTLYNSLLQCCLGINFQHSLLSGITIQVPSMLQIFFQWIPQTDLQTKFLNDLQIIMESNENRSMLVQMAEFYDFLFELAYKCLVFEEMGDKRVYGQKLQTTIKRVFSKVYEEDMEGKEKFGFILDWMESRRKEYNERLLLLSCRWVTMLMLQTIEEHVIMNNGNSPTMEVNFQNFGGVLCRVVQKALPSANVDSIGRVHLPASCEVPLSLQPYFKSKWIDLPLCQKYLFLFKKFFCTEWYLAGVKHLLTRPLLSYLISTGAVQIAKEAVYYHRGLFLNHLIFLHRCILAEDAMAADIGLEALWQTICLLLFAELGKTPRQQRSQIIASFLQSTKHLAELSVGRIVQIVRMLSEVKHFLSISLSADGKHVGTYSTVVLDEIITNYIPSALLIIEKDPKLEEFMLHFSKVWTYTKGESESSPSMLFVRLKEKWKEVEGLQTVVMECVADVQEEENARYDGTSVLLEAEHRYVLDNYRQLWRELRVYDISWRHAQLSWQQDTLFHRALYAYERYEHSALYTWEVAEQCGKSKARYWLIPRLVEPSITHPAPQRDKHFALHQAIMAIGNRIDVGRSKLGWLVPRGQDSLIVLAEFKQVRIIQPLTARTGWVALLNDRIIFTAASVLQKETHLTIDRHRLLPDQTICLTWPLEFVREVVRRRYVNRYRAIEVWFVHGVSVFFEFLSKEEADEFGKRLHKLKGTKCVNYVGKSLDSRILLQGAEYTKKWMHHEMSNFDYLLELNNLGGRAYCDMTQYYVMPWTLVTSKGQEEEFRDLSLPMGALGAAGRRATFEERFESLDVEAAERFHYGTHYSCPGIVYHYLLRLSPYTEGAVLLQSGKFDFADRLFFSMSQSYKNATSEYSDVRELLPEMYTIPQVYLNLNGLNLGTMQSKRRVHNVELPEWANDNPFLFVAKLREGFQHAKVSASLHGWVDLIFGFKQRGEEAIRSLNCFYPITYENAVDWNASDISLVAVESQVINFGQTPSQIFVRPHPQRLPLATIRPTPSLCDASSLPKVYRHKNTDAVQQLEFNVMRQGENAVVFMKWVKENRLAVLQRGGTYTLYKWQLSPVNSKIPFLCSIQKTIRIDRLRTDFLDSSLLLTNFPAEIFDGGRTLFLGGFLEGRLIQKHSEGGESELNSGHKTTVCALKACAKDKFMVSGDLSGGVTVWYICAEGVSPRLRSQWSANSQVGQITGIDICLQLICVGTSSIDGSVMVRNLVTGEPMRAYYHPKNLPIHDLLLTTAPLAAVILFCPADSSLYAYSLNGQLIHRLIEKGLFFSPTLLRDSSFSQFLVYGTQRGEIIRRALPFLDLAKKLTVSQTACVNQICLSKNQRYLVAGCSDGELSVVTDQSKK